MPREDWGAGETIGRQGMMREMQVEWWRPQASDAAHLPPPAAAASAAPSSDVPFWALIGFTFVLLFSPQAYFPELAVLRPALLLAGLGLATYGYERWSNGRPFVVWTREMRVMGYLVLWAVVTMPFSMWPGGSLAMVLDQYAKTLIIFWLLSHVVATIERLRRVAWSLSLMAIGLGGFAVYNYLSGAMIQGAADRLIGNEGSLTKNPNDMALMVNLIVPLTISLFLCTRSLVTRIVLVAAIGLEAFTVVITYSRAGALTLGTIFLLYFWKLRRRAERKLLYAVLLAGLLVLPLLPSTYFERLGTMTDVQADLTGSSQERWRDMTIALDTFLSNPLTGAGIGMNVLAMNGARGEWRAVHNVYLEHAIDLGLPGLVLFLVLLALCIRAAVSAQRRSVAGHDRDLFHLAEGLQISLLAFAVAAMFHPVSYHFYFYYIAGLAVAVGRFSAAEEPGRL